MTWKWDSTTNSALWIMCRVVYFCSITQIDIGSLPAETATSTTWSDKRLMMIMIVYDYISFLDVFFLIYVVAFFRRRCTMRRDRHKQTPIQPKIKIKILKQLTPAILCVKLNTWVRLHYTWFKLWCGYRFNSCILFSSHTDKRPCLHK